MKNYIVLFLGCIAFANVYAQEFPKPTLASPEDTFYAYLDNEHISDPTKYKGKVKKVIRTFKQYRQGVGPTTVEKVFMFLDEKKVLTKTVTRYYAFGIEESKEVINHLETPKAEITQKGNITIKTIKEELPDYVDYTIEQKGDDHYVYTNELLTAFYNYNDSIAYTYDSQKRPVSKRHFISLLADDFTEEEDGSYTQWRSAFEDRSFEKIIYQNELPVRKIIYDKFGEVIDIYKKNYSYNTDKLLTKFETEYKRYLYDSYDISTPIDEQEYVEFPRVFMKDSLQIGTFQYSKTNKITAYQRTKGEEKEIYTITYDKNDRMYLVEGTLTFYRRGKLISLEIEYEYLYDEKGNPKMIKSYFYPDGEKVLERETIFEIEYE
ncbi:MAG: hypothetical protein AAF611_14165 [Bacteroidota bacterium]